MSETHARCQRSLGDLVQVKNSHFLGSWACHSCVFSLAPLPEPTHMDTQINIHKNTQRGTGQIKRPHITATTKKEHIQPHLSIHTRLKKYLIEKVTKFFTDT